MGEANTARNLSRRQPLDRHNAPHRQERAGMSILKSLLHDRRGATAIEYALLLALLALVMLAVLNSLGFTLAGVFETVTNAMGG
jgi:pilus assembly protein Flp/PilA